VAIHALTRALAARGLGVDVATTDDHGQHHLAVPFGKALPWDGVRYWFFPRHTRPYTASAGLLAWLVRHGSDYQIIHIHGLFSFPSTIASLVARMAHVPYFVQPHGSLGAWGFAQRRPVLKQASFRCIERAMIDRAGSLYLNTESEELEVRQLGIDRPVDIVPYAMALPRVDRTVFTARFRQAYPQLRSKQILLFLSRIDPKKGVDILLQAFQRIHADNPMVALVIVGDGQPEYLRKVKADVRNLGLDESVHFTGFLSGEAKWAAIAAADLYVLPSYSENFGIAVIEAMSGGTPVVVTRGAAVSQFVETAGGGAIADCTSDSLSQVILELFGDSHRLRRLSEEAQRSAQAWSADSVAARTIGLYAKFVQ
jgi:glycosyltransferase involved in cell wall biosynthesis